MKKGNLLHFSFKNIRRLKHCLTSPVRRRKLQQRASPVLGEITNSRKRSNTVISQPKPRVQRAGSFSGSSRGSAQHDFSFASWGKKGSCGSLSRRRQRWKLTHQLWVESQTRIKDAQTVRFRSQSCHLFRLSLQHLLTRSRSCYFSFAAGGKKRKRLLTGSAQA